MGKHLIGVQWKYVHEVGLISAIKPALVSITSNTWAPLLSPQLLRGEVCPFNVANWLIYIEVIDRTIVIGITLNYGDTASAPQATPHMSYNSKAEWQ